MNGVRAHTKARALVNYVPIPPVLAQKCLRFVVGNRVLRATVITLWYLAVVSFGYYGAFLLRFDGNIPPYMFEVIYRTLPVLMIIRIITFRRFQLYSGLLHYVSVDDVWRTMKAVTISTLVFMLVIYLIQVGFQGFPRSVFVVETLLTLGILSGHRMALRALRERSHNGKNTNNISRKILLVGDLDSADSLLRVIKTGDNQEKDFVGIVHETPSAQGKTLRGVTVLGGLEELAAIVEKCRPGEVLILPPYTCSPRSLRNVIDRCSVNGSFSPKYQMVPSLLDIADGRIPVSMIRSVEIEDLLGRPPVKMDRTDVRQFLSGKAVMVTGAGGSIGSELCRQIGSYNPRLLLLYELSEYNLYQIDMHMRERYPTLEVIPVTGDVCDQKKLDSVLDRYGIEVIYHAAAYKHVPLMESNVAACVRTNVVGTERLARAAEKYSVDKFVLISSDKAVRPTSVMGASKRLAERIIQERNPSDTKFVAVRFGNVLGSSGSVIPLFKRQIKAGGPVTVTDPDIRRYFMSIPEAVDLLLQAAIVGGDREIMVLEMGEPIRILDLAIRLIELSGLRPNMDIEIKYSGLRPGEKLYEELLTSDDVVRTQREKIWVMRNREDRGHFPHVGFAEIEAAIQEGDDSFVRTLLRRWIPENQFRMEDTCRREHTTSSPPH